jgi:hypothetical protein
MDHRFATFHHLGPGGAGAGLVRRHTRARDYNDLQMAPTPSPLPTPGRILAARIIAVAADCLELLVFPSFMPGFLSPFNDVLDIAVGASLIWLLGWHWAFLPSFVAEMVPGLSLVPSWTAAVFIATGFGPAKMSVKTVNPGSPQLEPGSTDPEPRS